MNKQQKEAARQAAVMLAYSEGKEIERRSRDNLAHGNASWHDETGPIWDWYSSDYRVKQVPREFVMWVHPNGGWSKHTANINDTDAARYKAAGWEIITVVEKLRG